MKPKVIYILFLLFSVFACKQSGEKSKSEFPVMKGPYLGQQPPGMIAKIFAPGIISNGLVNRDVAMMPDGNEMYFGIHNQNFKYASILVSKRIDDVWTKPEVVSFASDPRYIYLEPFISPDGKKLFFLSNMPKDTTGNPAEEDIWVANRTENGWSKPYNLGSPVNSDDQEFYPSLTTDGTLYFTRAIKGNWINYIYRSRFVDGKYSTPERLPEQVNCGSNRFNAYISPDESYLVLPAIGVEEGVEGVNYYIVFRNKDDSWQEPINIGPAINSPDNGNGWSFFVSPDKKYIFFMASKNLPKEKQPDTLSLNFFLNLSSIPQNGSADIYWIDAKVLEKLKSKQ